MQMKRVPPKDLQPIAAALHDWAETEPRVGCIWFFGSRAFMRHRPDSDLDIAASVLGEVDELTFQRLQREWRAVCQARSPFKVDFNLADPERAPSVWEWVHDRSLLIFRRLLVDQRPSETQNGPACR